MARHREYGSLGSNWFLGLLIGVLVGSIGVFVAADRFRDSSATTDDPAAGATSSAAVPTACTTTTTVTAVAPGPVVPMLQDAAAQACVELDLTQSDGRDGVDASESADLWVTDSSLWAAARSTDPGPATSIASSPIVGLANADTAAGLGDGTTISWADLLSPDRTVRLGFHDPSSTATGLLAAWPFLKAQRDVSDVPYEALALTAAALSQPAIVGQSVLDDPPSDMLVFAAEYLARPSDNVSILRGREGEAVMDFPAYNLAQDADVRIVVADMITRLASADTAELRADAHLRDPDGTAEFDTTALGEAGRRMQLPNDRSTIKLYGLGASGSTPGRILVLLDVSSSMGTTQADGLPLIDSVRNTALIAMSSLYDHTSVGVWLYGTDIDGTDDYRELVPITSLASGRKRIINAVKTIGVVPGSQGSLYDTVLAGYQELQSDFDPAAAQSLVVFTNTSRDSTSGMSVKSLIAQLKAEADPDKHIRVMGVGFGEHADVEGLKQISAEMGGTSARIQGPVPMLGLFITMVGQVAAQG